MRNSINENFEEAKNIKTIAERAEAASHLVDACMTSLGQSAAFMKGSLRQFLEDTQALEGSLGKPDQRQKIKFDQLKEFCSTLDGIRGMLESYQQGICH